MSLHHGDHREAVHVCHDVHSLAKGVARDIAAVKQCAKSIAVLHCSHVSVLQDGADDWLLGQEPASLAHHCVRVPLLAFPACDTEHDDVGFESPCERPEHVLGGLACLDLLLDELRVACVRVRIDFVLIVVLDVFWLAVERQVLLAAVRDSADIKLVFAGSVESSDRDRVGQIGRVATIHANHVVVAAFSGCKFKISLNHLYL